jgi:hypothetical protein
MFRIRRGCGRAAWPAASLCITPSAVSLAGVLLAAAWLCTAARADKGLNNGVYRDREGKEHTWVLERSHLMTWNEKPYVPVGIVFRSAYLSAPSADALQKDGTELDRLKSAGIQDIWIEPGRGLLQNTVQQTQTIIDAVETRGFRYGLRVGDRFQQPLVGFSPTLVPIKVPVAKLQPGKLETWDVQVPGSRRVLYTIADLGKDDTIHNWAVATGEALVERDRAHLEVQFRNSRLLGKSRGLLLVVPEVQVEVEDLGSFGDLWVGMERYAEQLKKYLQALKFGAGLRFVLDPFAAGDGTVGQEDMVFPSSQEFRAGFKEWLSKRVGINGINNRWRLTDGRLTGLEQAARLVPAWPSNDPPDGDGWLIDPVDKVSYRCVPRQSEIWKDLGEFRADALKRWMDSITTTLKQEGLNVPMIFSWGAYHPLFTNSPSPAGYDGLGGQLYGNAATLDRDLGAYALAQAEEADRNTWLIATRLAGPVGPEGNPAPLTDTGQLRAAWEAIRGVGFRGVFLDPQQAPNAVAMARELAAAASADSADMRKKVPICFFPLALATADRVTRLSNGVWWLPSGTLARILRYGDTVMGYEIGSPFGDDHSVRTGTVLWSTRGKQEFSFYVNKLQRLSFFDSAGQPLKIVPKKEQVKLTLTNEPLVATGLDIGATFPVELAVAQLKEMDALLKQAEAEKGDTAALRILYKDAVKSLAPNSAAAIYNSMAPHVARLRVEVTPYIWLEGERPLSHNFSGTAFQAGSSTGTYLKLDRGATPPFGVYKARYGVEVRRDASYEIWIAGRVPGRAGVSPLIWQMDEEVPVTVRSATPSGSDYSNGMAWYSLGRMTLKAGVHELTLFVPEKAGGAGGRYAMGIDAIVLSRDTFHPNGIEKPYGKPSPAAVAEK